MDICCAITFLLGNRALGRAEDEDKSGIKRHDRLRPVKRIFVKSQDNPRE